MKKLSEMTMDELQGQLDNAARRISEDQNLIEEIQRQLVLRWQDVQDVQIEENFSLDESA